MRVDPVIANLVKDAAICLGLLIVAVWLLIWNALRDRD